MSGEHVRRSSGAVTYVAAWSLITLLGAVIVGTVLVPRIAGATPYVIATGSMKPTLAPGTMVVTRPIAAASVRIGTVVTYQLVSGEPAVVTHRVVGQGITAAGAVVFRTKGDANTANDPGWVRPEQIRGARWYAVPYLGHLTNRLNSVDRVLVQRTVAVALLGYVGLLALGALRQRRTAVEP